MGRKVNPIGFRLAVQKDWRSKWYATKQEFTQFLHEDIKVRTYLKKKLQTAAVSKIVKSSVDNLDLSICAPKAPNKTEIAANAEPTTSKALIYYF